MSSPTASLIDRSGLDCDHARRDLARGLEGADDGELSSNNAVRMLLRAPRPREPRQTSVTGQRHRASALSLFEIASIILATIAGGNA
jgi:hypothetical protein